MSIAGQGLGEAEVARLSADGEGIALHADGDSMLLVVSGEPIDEPVFGYGPFVMTNESEIREAIEDFNSGKFARAAA